uniref:Uncharacterized protein n=1 Tax=Triticum urartu TaxID=4572 RepID=A0A8R7PI83_TRIUA
MTRVSPAITGFLNLTLSTPAKKKLSWDPPTSGCSITMPPTWAMASTMRTPGIIGRSGKWPGKKLSFIVTFLIATAYSPALYSMTLSTRRKGNLWGRISRIWLMSMTAGKAANLFSMGSSAAALSSAAAQRATRRCLGAPGSARRGSATRPWSLRGAGKGSAARQADLGTDTAAAVSIGAARVRGAGWVWDGE